MWMVQQVPKSQAELNAELALIAASVNDSAVRFRTWRDLKANPLPTTIYSYNKMVAKNDANPPVIRYVEQKRTKLVVVNPDTQGRDIQVAYINTTNANGNYPSTWTTVPAGSQFVDTSGNTQKIYARTPTGQAVSGAVTIMVYTEITV